MSKDWYLVDIDIDIDNTFKPQEQKKDSLIRKQAKICTDISLKRICSWQI